MKKSYRFVALCLALTAFFCIISAVCTAVCLENVRKTTNSTVNRLVAVMLEKYPDISEKEIAEILNDKTAVEDDCFYRGMFITFKNAKATDYGNSKAD